MKELGINDDLKIGYKYRYTQGEESYEFIVGDVNKNGGVCDCCKQIYVNEIGIGSFKIEEVEKLYSKSELIELWNKHAPYSSVYEYKYSLSDLFEEIEKEEIGPKQVDVPEGWKYA